MRTNAYPRTCPQGSGRNEMWEFLWLIPVLAILILLSLDLAAAGPLGRGHRYMGTDPDSRAVQWLLDNSGNCLIILAFSGWIMLVAARRAGHNAFCIIVFVLLNTALWRLIYRTGLGPVQQNDMLWICAVLLGVLLFIHRVGIKNRPRQDASSPLIYPVFMFLVGLSLLWLLDFSARAMPTGLVPWMGLGRWKDAVLAMGVMSVASACAPHGLSLLIRLFSWFDSGGPSFSSRISPFFRKFSFWGFPLAVAVTTGIVFAVLQNAGLENTGKKPILQSKTSEILRLVGYFFIAWIVFRWGLWSRGWWKTRILIVSLVLSIGFVATKDFGQILVIAMALCVLGPALFSGIQRICGRFRLSIVLSAIVSILLVWAGIFTLKNVVLPPWLASHPSCAHIVSRINTIQTPFVGKKAYLSEIRWFLADSPVGGFGLGNTPYCGTRGAKGLSLQTPSDYVFGALSGIFGPVMAWLITAITAGWLLLLCSRKSLPSSHSYTHACQYATWVAFVFAAFNAAQLFVAAFGSLGIIPLTGVTYPLLSHGGASFLMTTGISALVISTPMTTAMVSKREEGPHAYQS